MKEEKTLSEKKWLFYSEEIWRREEDIKQFIKEVLDEIEKIDDFGMEVTKVIKREVIKIIKQKSGGDLVK